MVTVLRAHGLRFVIFVNDHEPAHVHVFGDGEARVNLSGANGKPELMSIEGMKRGDVRSAMRIVVEQQNYLFAKWKEIHGGNE
jgi:Domain of unknown function (DUF4160)